MGNIRNVETRETKDFYTYTNVLAPSTNKNICIVVDSDDSNIENYVEN